MASTDLAARTAFYGIIICWWLFALTFWLRKHPPRAREARRDLTSYFGLFLQAAGYFIVWFYPLKRRQFSPIASGPEWLSWLLAALALAIAAASVFLVIWSARRLGKQWALAARIVEDHALIQDGPYRLVRNPIYLGMLGMLLATGLVTTQWILLLIASVLFGAGTYIRIRIEERLLREAFGTRFEEYARTVPALIPGVY